MRESPKHRISADAVKAWKITASIYIGILWLIAIIAGIIIWFFAWPFWIIIAAIVINIVCTYLFIVLLPKKRWERWRYEVFEQEIYIQHGILILSQTLVPMIRVQHVDTKQGPILKKFHLASVTISTAATTHEIPALDEENAYELRDRISRLARVDEDDV